uniref:Uncharacterized protein n=1 Tax=Cacopsylla melanoneura TaxID=428564 RepID=A0A8D9F4U2_9HEMI
MRKFKVTLSLSVIVISCISFRFKVFSILLMFQVCKSSFASILNFFQGIRVERYVSCGNCGIDECPLLYLHEICVTYVQYCTQSKCLQVSTFTSTCSMKSKLSHFTVHLSETNNGTVDLA